MTDLTKHYGEILKELEAERDALNRAIEVIRRKAGLKAQSDKSIGGHEKPTNQMEQGASEVIASPWIKSDAFFSMTAADAAQAYLSMIKRPAKPNEILAAILRGGYTNKSENPYQTLFAALTRNQDKTFANLGRAKGWGLKSWYGSKSSQAD